MCVGRERGLSLFETDCCLCKVSKLRKLIWLKAVLVCAMAKSTRAIHTPPMLLTLQELSQMSKNIPPKLGWLQKHSRTGLYKVMPACLPACLPAFGLPHWMPLHTTLSHTHIHTHTYTHKSTHFILDSHHPAMLGDGDTRHRIAVVAILVTLH